MQRSGTTLLARLLASAPRMNVLLQAFPLLLVGAKREFLATLGEADRQFPLGHLLLETTYCPGSFTTFLRQFRPTRRWLAGVFAEMADYSGQYTRVGIATLERALAGLPVRADFAHILQRLCFSSSPSGTEVAGTKEMFGEELIPYLLARGWRCIVIIRDPRDVLHSLNSGRGPQIAGRPKPVLLDVRNWRKSIAFAFRYERHRHFAWLRYEDLVLQPDRTLTALTTRLGLPHVQPQVGVASLRELGGEIWEGNSSHGPLRGLDPTSVGGYVAGLTPAVIAYVEATCGPEMAALGYPTTLLPAEAPRVISSFRDPFDGARSELAGYSADPRHLTEEIRRLELLAHPDEPLWPWFLFAATHRRLRATWPTTA